MIKKLAAALMSLALVLAGGNSLAAFAGPPAAGLLGPRLAAAADYSWPVAVPSACVVKEAKFLGQGGSPAWSPANDWLAYQKWDASGVYQLRMMRPDGSGDKCITCTAQAGAPRVDRHKVNYNWHPSGRYLVLQGEMDNHPLVWFSRDKFISELMVNGLWTNLYVTSPDGSKWYRLTNYSSSATDGAMSPWFSADGSKLLWTRLVAPASNENPWGLYRLMVADFVETNGVPSLANIRDITPAGAKFVEPHGFSPDGRTVLFTGDMENTHNWGMDIWSTDLATGALKNLTKSPHWDEHASYSPGGKKIVYMSSEPYLWALLKTELMVMSADGTSRSQLTHFNVPGYPESTAEQSMPTRANWNSDGSRLAVTQQMVNTYPATQMWLFTFAGICGD